MDKSKKNLVLAAILVALIAFAYWFTFKPGQSQGQKNNFVSDVNFEEVDEIMIAREGSTSTIEKKEGKWKLEGEGEFAIKESLATKINEKFADLSKAEFSTVSENPDKKEEFHTNRENGTEIKWFSNGEQVAHFIVGRMDSPTLSSTYISKPGEDKTYSARDVQLTSVFITNDMRSKVVFDRSKSNIDELRFQYPDSEFKLKKTEAGDEWKGVEPNEFEVDSEKVDKILNAMSSLEAVKIPEQTFEGTGLDKHLIIVEAKGYGTSNTIMIGEKDGKEGDKELYFAKRGDSDSIYLIGKEQRDALKTSVEELKP